VHQDLLVQIERLHPNGALRIVKALFAEENSSQLALALAGLSKGYVERQVDQRQSEREAL